MRPAALTTVITAALLALTAACTSPEPGQASPNTDQPITSGKPSSNAAGNSLNSISACGLLTDAEARQVVPGTGSHQDNGTLGGPGTSSCSWTLPVTSNVVGHVFSVSVRPAQGLKDIVADAPGEELVNAKTTGGRSALLQKNAEGNRTCEVSIAVGAGRVDIFDTTKGSTDDACSTVSRLSDFVEPRLPAS